MDDRGVVHAVAILIHRQAKPPAHFLAPEPL